MSLMCLQLPLVKLSRSIWSVKQFQRRGHRESQMCGLKNSSVFIWEEKKLASVNESLNLAKIASTYQMFMLHILQANDPAGAKSEGATICTLKITKPTGIK